MRGFLTFVFYAIVLVLGGALEMMLPKPMGVGVPILLGWTVWEKGIGNREQGIGGGVVLAMAAGAFEDALSSLPFLTSVSFFVVGFYVSRFLGFWVSGFWGSVLSLVVVYPLYRLWLWLIVPTDGRLGTAVPTGVLLLSLAAAAVVAVFAWFGRKAAL